MSEGKKKYIVVQAPSLRELVTEVNGLDDYEAQGGLSTNALYSHKSGQTFRDYFQAMVLKEQPKPLVTTREHLEDVDTGFHIIRPNSIGFCPKCGAEGFSRERRLDGDDTCANGCRYKSTDALKVKPPAGAVIYVDQGRKGGDETAMCKVEEKEGKLIYTPIHPKDFHKYEEPDTALEEELEQTKEENRLLRVRVTELADVYARAMRKLAALKEHTEANETESPKSIGETKHFGDD
jgi:hypothetical protein